MGITQKPHLHANWIDTNAWEIVEKLQKSGFKTYLVGGCVRDLLLGLHPKDYDIATSAIPQQVKRKIPYSFIIGRRFRLVLVRRAEHQFEVATFRRNIRPDDVEEGEIQPEGDNFFGTPEEDALRRDFTINALFYDPLTDQLIDYADGLKDIDNQIIRIIGEPDARLKEDAIRILRGVRLAHKLNFVIEPSLRESMKLNASALATSALPRRREEYLKILRLHDPSRALLELHDLGILKEVLPTLHKLFENPKAQDIFLQYIDQIPQFVEDLSQPVELFGSLILAYVRALVDDPFDFSMFDDEDSIPASSENSSPSLNSFMRDELGMFKAEQIDVYRWLTYPKNIAEKIESFRKKGPRRQQAFLSHDGVEKALRLSRKDFLLSPHELMFWQEQAEKLEVRIVF